MATLVRVEMEGRDERLVLILSRKLRGNVLNTAHNNDDMMRNVSQLLL